MYFKSYEMKVNGKVHDVLACTNYKVNDFTEATVKVIVHYPVQNKDRILHSLYSWRNKDSQINNMTHRENMKSWIGCRKA